MRKKSQLFRLLVIEDNVERVNIFRQWIYEGTPLVVASSTGVAMGMLKRDNNRKNGRVYSGILLDHDLREQAILASDLSLSATNLIDLIIENIEKDVPILMHSMNRVEATSMKKRLEAGGFDVTQNPMAKLTKIEFDEWLTYCYELWEDLSDDD